MTRRKQRLSAGGNEAPLGCLLGQPAEVSRHRVREVSKETGVSECKVKTMLAGNPVGLTFDEYERLRRALVKGDEKQ
jgi:hypothetical protein